MCNFRTIQYFIIFEMFSPFWWSSLSIPPTPFHSLLPHFTWFMLVCCCLTLPSGNGNKGVFASLRRLRPLRGVGLWSNWGILFHVITKQTHTYTQTPYPLFSIRIYTRKHQFSEDKDYYHSPTSINPSKQNPQNQFKVPLFCKLLSYICVCAREMWVCNYIP